MNLREGIRRVWIAIIGVAEVWLFFVYGRYNNWSRESMNAELDYYLSFAAVLALIGWISWHFGLWIIEGFMAPKQDCGEDQRD